MRRPARRNPSLLEGVKGAVSVRQVWTPHGIEDRHGHAGIQTSVPLLVHGHASSHCHQADFLFLRDTEAAEPQEVSAHMGDDAQVAFSDGHPRRKICPQRQHRDRRGFLHYGDPEREEGQDA